MNNTEATELAATITRSLHLKVMLSKDTSISSLGRVMNVDRSTVKNRLESGDVSLRTLFIIATETGCDPVDLIQDAMDLLDLDFPCNKNPTVRRGAAPRTPSRKGPPNGRRSLR